MQDEWERKILLLYTRNIAVFDVKGKLIISLIKPTGTVADIESTVRYTYNNLKKSPVQLKRLKTKKKKQTFNIVPRLL